jgi:hypothetical protein
MVEANGSDNRQSAAAYIERMAVELSRMAASANLTMLVYLLEMVSEEAADAQSRRLLPTRPAPPDGTRVPRTLNIGNR